jgi:hypothetical protein
MCRRDVSQAQVSYANVRPKDKRHLAVSLSAARARVAINFLRRRKRFPLKDRKALAR